MIKTLIAVAASRVILDSISNQVSIIDVFEGMKSQSFPIVIPSITFLFYLQREAGDPSAKELSLKCTVDGIENLKIPVNIDFQQGYTTRTIVSFDGFVVPKAGELKISLLDDDAELGVVSLPVDILEIPQPEIKTGAQHPSE